MSAAPEDRLQRRALIVAAVTMVVLALISGGGDGGEAVGQPPSTMATGPGGAKALFELTRELGLDSQRWMLPTDEQPFRDRVHALAILGAGASLTRAEAQALLDWVRAGGRLFYAPLAPPLRESERDPLLLALGVRGLSRASAPAWRAKQEPVEDQSAEARELLQGTPAAVSCPAGALDLGGLASDTPCEVLLGRDDGHVALALLHPGSGQLVLLADAAALANGELAKSELSVCTVRALASLADGGPVCFDEFHHGYDERASVASASRRFLLTTHAGWALLALLAVALLAVACRGVRLGPPVPEPPAAGRSSLEHVDALAAAWAGARAHGRPAGLLVEGLRLRLGVAQHKDLGERLSAAALRAPELRAAIDTIRAAGAGQGGAAVAPDGLVPLAHAVDAVLHAEGRHALPSGWDARS